MPDKNPSPLRASFWLTKQEQRYILAICALALLGIAVRYFYLKKEIPEVYTPAGIEKSEPGGELITQRRQERRE